MICCSSPQGGKTTNWRAGCGKSASPVRREGRRKSMRRSYPYSVIKCFGDSGLKWHSNSGHLEKDDIETN